MRTPSLSVRLASRPVAFELRAPATPRSPENVGAAAAWTAQRSVERVHASARTRAHVAELVEYLALGPPPELQACPFCASVGMRAATRCGTCWRKLDPPAPLARA